MMISEFAHLLRQSLMKYPYPLLFMAVLFQGCAGQVVVPPAAQPDTTIKPAQNAKAESPAEKAAVPPSKPLSAEILYHLLSGEVAGQRGQLAEAVAHYMKAMRLSQDPKVAERAARIAVFARDDQSALEAAKVWVNADPENLEAQQVMAALLVRSGQGDAALSHFEKILTQTARNEQHGFSLIVSLLSKERDKKTALAVMEKLVAKRRQNPAALYAYSHLAMLAGNLQQAAETVGKALSLRPDWTEAHLLRANIFIRQGQQAKALKTLAQAVERYPGNTVLRMFYARKLVDEKRYDEARKQFARVLKEAPDHPDALYALGLLGMQLNKLSQAEKSFKRLIKLGKRLDEAHYYLGQLKEMQDEPEAAIASYQAVKKEPNYLEAQIRIAMILSKQGKLEEARERLHQIKATTLEMELHLYLAEGEILRSAKEYRQAFELYSEALEAMPENSRLLYARALIADKLGRLDIAIADLEQILKNEPDNAEAMNALGYTLVDQTDRLEEGMRYIQEALKKRPDDPAIIDSMGWAYYRLGNYESALKYLRRAFELMQDPEIASHLGEVLWVSGDQKAARKVWDDALRQTPKHEILLDVIQRFTQ